LLYIMRDTAPMNSSYTKMHGLERVVTCRDVTQQVEFGLKRCSKDTAQRTLLYIGRYYTAFFFRQ